MAKTEIPANSRYWDFDHARAACGRCGKVKDVTRRQSRPDLPWLCFMCGLVWSNAVDTSKCPKGHTDTAEFWGCTSEQCGVQTVSTPILTTADVDA